MTWHRLCSRLTLHQYITYWRVQIQAHFLVLKCENSSHMGNNMSLESDSWITVFVKGVSTVLGERGASTQTVIEKAVVVIGFLTIC